MKKIIFKIIEWLVTGLLLITTGLFIYSTLKLNFLELKYLTPIFIVMILFLILISFKLLRKKTTAVSKIIFGILGIVLSIIYITGLKYIGNTIDFLQNMTKGNKEVKEYSVMVLNDSKYQKIEDLDKKVITFLEEENQELVKQVLENKTHIKFDATSYNNLLEGIKKLEEKGVDALVLEKSYIDILPEINSSFLEEAKIIYTFDVHLKRKKTTTVVNNILTEPFILYISGSDSRSTVSAVARSDVNIICVVNPSTKKILLVSIPRDYYVQLHNTTGCKDKLTHAGVYGINMSIETIEDLLNIDINYYAKVSFATVVNAVDVIDGIDLYSDTSFTAHTNKKCNFHEGVNTVGGDCALAFSRERYAYTSGDRHRGENQQAVITAIIEKLSNPVYLTRYNDILKAIDGSFETSMTYDEITSLIKSQLTNISHWEVESISLDGVGSMMPTYSMGSRNLYVMIPNEDTVKDAEIKIKEYLNN